jgi:hypothetical protein
MTAFIAGILSLLAFIPIYTGSLAGLHISPRPKVGQIRIACVGDSITYGYRVNGQPWNCYPQRLDRLLGSGYCV